MEGVDFKVVEQYCVSVMIPKIPTSTPSLIVCTYASFVSMTSFGGQFEP